MANINVDEKMNDVAVVMVPLPAQGHLNQLLHLSHLISSYSIPVHFVGTPTHNRQAQVRVHGWDPKITSKLHFHDYPVPSFPTPPPNPNATNKFPTHCVPSLVATFHLRQPVYALVQNLSIASRRVIVIHDYLMCYVIQDVHSIGNAESYGFHGIAAFTMYTYQWEMAGKPVLADGIPINELLSGGPGTNIPKEMAHFLHIQKESRKRTWGSIYNSCRLIDGEYLSLIAQQKLDFTENHWAIGPFNPLEINQDKESEKRHRCLEWLDKQATHSVVFVSFGSLTSLLDEQVEEIAIGLENSGQKFIWVLRDADRGDVFVGESRRAKLPEGYERRSTSEGRGIIEWDWAPQLEILGHASTGGFMSHCGWNSCIESISLGVPMATWPMHSDQPRNAILVTKVLKIGLMVGDWGHEGELVKADVIEKAVKTLMDSAEGHEMRKKAGELRDAIKKSVTRGSGDDNTSTEMDTFIAHITR